MYHINVNDCGSYVEIMSELTSTISLLERVVSSGIATPPTGADMLTLAGLATRQDFINDLITKSLELVESAITGNGIQAIENAGGGQGLFIDTIAGTARFKSLSPGNDINITSVGDDLVIASTASSDIEIQKDGVTIVGVADTLNFTGDGVSVVDSGGGVATIDIPGETVWEENADVITPQNASAVLQLNAIDEANILTPAAGMINIDAADNNALKWYDGTSWLDAGGSGFEAGTGTDAFYTPLGGGSEAAQGNESLAVGYNARVVNGGAQPASRSIAIGHGAVVNSATIVTAPLNGTICIGTNSTARNIGTTLVGSLITEAASDAQRCTYVGSSITPGHTSAFQRDQTLIGAAISNSGGNSGFSTAVGSLITIGQTCIALGHAASVTHAHSIGIGNSATSTAQRQFVVGSSVNYITDVILGRGVTNSSPQALTIRNTSATGTNIAGANLTIQASRSTGNANGGNLVFQVSPPGASGSTLNTTLDAITISGALGNVSVDTDLDTDGRYLHTEIGSTISDDTDFIAANADIALPTPTRDGRRLIIYASGGSRAVTTTGTDVFGDGNIAIALAENDMKTFVYHSGVWYVNV